MKLLKLTKVIIAISITFVSCDKDDGNGSVLVTVKDRGQSIPQAEVYYKSGSDTMSSISPVIFDKQEDADASGQVYFENLSPGIYTFFTLGQSQNHAERITGKSTIAILRRYRQNYYEVIVNVEHQ